MVSGLNKDSF
ncbi:hypothetical protein VCHC44C1_3385A, partial [Vibrio cholerae HC-44C1]